MIKKRKILVLGGTGFLGKHVTSLMKSKRQYKIFSLSRKEGTDIRDIQALKKKLERIKPDVIINAAAHVGSVHYAISFAADMVHDNMQMLLNLYLSVKDICPKVKIINPISNCSYPGDANIHSEPDWEQGKVHDTVLPYASTRRMIYALARSYEKQYGIISINWLVANAYGPGDYSDPNKVHALNGIIIRLIKAQRAKDKTFEIWGTGKPVREWAYIQDVATILVRSITLKSQIYPLNLAQNKAYSIKQIATMVAKELDYKVKFTFNIKFPDGAPTKKLDNKLFKKQYSKFKFTPIDKGIANTIDYYNSIL